MALEDPSVLLNGVAYGFQSLRFIVGDEDLYFRGSTELSFSEKRERGKVWGATRSGRPLARTSGKYEAGKVKWKLTVKFWQQLRALLATQATDGVSYGNVVFHGLLQIIEPTDEQMHSIEFFDMTVEEITSNFSEGSDGLMQEIVFDTMALLSDGLSLADLTVDAP